MLDVRSVRNWLAIQQLAERVGFEPTDRLLTRHSISSRARYDHFGTSPFGRVPELRAFATVILKPSSWPLGKNFFPSFPGTARLWRACGGHWIAVARWKRALPGIRAASVSPW